MTRKLTNKDIDIRLKGRNIKRIDNYISAHVKIAFKCTNNTCNQVWNAKPSNVVNNKTDCPKCKKCLRITNKIADERLKGRNIKRLESMINVMEPIKFKCLIDNCIWKTKPHHIFNNHGCPRCAGLEKLNNKIVDKRLKSKNIKRIENYKNCGTKIEFQCLIDGHKWKTTPDNILNCNRGCPLCSMKKPRNMGKSELKIMNLIKCHIKYDIFKHKQRIKANNRHYFPDFYLEISNKKIIIEYNGRQHYMPVNFKGMVDSLAKKRFIKQQKRDEGLRHYCKENNIHLLEIPYTWKEDKVIEELQKLNVRYNLKERKGNQS